VFLDIGIRLGWRDRGTAARTAKAAVVRQRLPPEREPSSHTSIEAPNGELVPGSRSATRGWEHPLGDGAGVPAQAWLPVDDAQRGLRSVGDESLFHETGTRSPETRVGRAASEQLCARARRDERLRSRREEASAPWPSCRVRPGHAPSSGRHEARAGGRTAWPVPRRPA